MPLELSLFDVPMLVEKPEPDWVEEMTSAAATGPVLERAGVGEEEEERAELALGEAVDAVPEERLLVEEESPKFRGGMVPVLEPVRESPVEKAVVWEWEVEERMLVELCPLEETTGAVDEEEDFTANPAEGPVEEPTGLMVAELLLGVALLMLVPVDSVDCPAPPVDEVPATEELVEELEVMSVVSPIGLLLELAAVERLSSVEDDVDEKSSVVPVEEEDVESEEASPDELLLLLASHANCT